MTRTRLASRTRPGLAHLVKGWPLGLAPGGLALTLALALTSQSAPAQGPPARPAAAPTAPAGSPAPATTGPTSARRVATASDATAKAETNRTDGARSGGRRAEGPPPDPRLQGYAVSDGFRAEVVAGDDLLPAPPAWMAFDDKGRAYVAEVAPSARTFDVWESIGRGDDGTVRLVKRHKSVLDCIRRLADTDGDGRYDSAEIVVDAVEQPTGLVWSGGSLYLTALGRLERWSDEDGDDHFETRTVLLDGLGAIDGRGLVGLTLGLDGDLYLTAGDNETQAFAPGRAGAPLRQSRSGALYRCRTDGTNLRLVAQGFRQPRGPVQFDAEFRPLLFDDDGADGSRLGGVRLIQPVEGGDYGWRLLPGSVSPDHDLGTLDGDRPGRLAGATRRAGVAPASFVIYEGSLLPAALRGLLIAADPLSQSIRVFRLASKDGVTTLQEPTLPLLAGTVDERFRPVQVVVGADAALYILDRRDAPAADSTPGASATAGSGSSSGRIIRLAPTPGGPLATQVAFPNHWDRIKTFNSEQLLFGALPNPDGPTAERGLQELIDRGADAARGPLLGIVANASLAPRVRILGLLGARRCWNDAVEAGCVHLLADPNPAIRRLAAQGLADEPATPQVRLATKLLERLDDPDPRAARAILLAIGRHGATNPSHSAPNLIRWLLAHPKADGLVRDGALRALERLGDGGVDEVALAVKTRRGVERTEAVRLFVGLRTARAAENLTTLSRIPDLAGPERAALIRQYADFPATVQVATTPLVEWVVKHPEVDPSVKLATLETCRLVGNPASTLIRQLIDDEDEAVRITATRLAGRTHPPGCLPRLAARLGDGQLGDGERLVIAQSLRGAGAGQFAALDEAYLAAERPELRRALLRALTDADRAKALPALTAALAGPDPVTHARVLAILAETPAGALQLAQSYLDRTLNRADLPSVLQALERHESTSRERERLAKKEKDKDKAQEKSKEKTATQRDGASAEESLTAEERDARALRNALTVVLRDATEGESALRPAAIRQQAAASGNPWAGRALFFGQAARCSTCHEVAGQGARTSLALDATAGLDPERIAAGLRHANRTTRASNSPGGTGGNPTATNANANANAPQVAARPRPDRADSAGTPRPLAGLDRTPPGSGSATPAPPLPTGLDLRLTPTELADLVAFLSNAAVQDAVRSGRVEPVTPWLVAGPFALGPDGSRVPLDRIDPGKGFPGQGGRRVAWQPQVASSGGRLDLDGWLSAEPGRLYAATELRADAAQVAWLSVTTPGALRIYLNGARVADLAEAGTASRSATGGLADAPAPQVRLPLRAGANLLLLAFDPLVEGQPAATLVLASPQVVRSLLPLGVIAPSAKPDGAKPDGARPDGAKPDGAKPDGAKPDGARPEGTKADGAKPEGAARPEGAANPDPAAKTGDGAGAGATDDRPPPGNVVGEAPATSGASPSRDGNRDPVPKGLAP